MRKVEWNTVQAQADGEFRKLPAGPYVGRIVQMVDKEDKQYVECIYDIAEGEYVGFYSDDWGKGHPYAHHLILSYKDSALGMLKGRLEAIQKSNPGFDPFAAWDAGRLDMFEMRLIGLNLREEEYINSSNEIRTRLDCRQVVPVQDVRDGKVKTLPLKKLGGEDASAASTGAGDDIKLPF